MKNFIKISFLVFLASFYKIEAQQVTKKDTLNGNVLSVTMDKEIDQLLTNMEDKCTNTSIGSNSGSESNSPRITTPSTPKVVVPSRPLTNAEICRQNPRILGYKIQLVIVKSNDEANEVKAYFRRRFPNLKAETDASLRPNYKILVGSYFTKQTAAADFARIKQYFKEARLVQYRVFCAEAK